MIEGQNDLDAAERALRDAYQQVCEKANVLSLRGRKAVGQTIVHIMPRGRRVESGWYKMARWADKSSDLVGDLDLEFRDIEPSLDEVFVAGEALAGTPREIVNLLFHQWVHQFAGVESTSTYHGREFLAAAHALGVIDVERHATQGWVEFDYGIALDGVLRDVAASLDRKAFDLYRHPEAEAKGSGKMKLWTCKCRKGARVYTGAILHATCRECGYEFQYAHKDRFQSAVMTRILRGGESVVEE